MVRTEKTVFISYRRVDSWQALAVFKDLTHHGYDVFIDYDGIASGDFERSIVDNIRARAHFVLVLTPTALMRSNDPADWMRREIEVALDSQRNIVPLLLDGFTFKAPLVIDRLQGSLKPLPKLNALRVPEDSAYFDTAMELLRSKYLAIAPSALTQPASPHAQRVAHEQQDAASRAATLHKQNSEQSDLLAIWGGDATGHHSVAPVEDPLAASLHKVFGDDYYLGRNGRTQDDAAAVRWYRMAAERGNAEGQVMLAFMYREGRGGLVQDDVEAVKWYRKAAEQGNADGQSHLGSMYVQGRGGLARNDPEAVKWFRKAAEQGDEAGQTNLGFMYARGSNGLAKDEAEALKWYRKAAEQGYEPAQNHLAYIERTNDL